MMKLKSYLMDTCNLSLVIKLHLPCADCMWRFNHPSDLYGLAQMVQVYIFASIV